MRSMRARCSRREKYAHSNGIIIDVPRHDFSVFSSENAVSQRARRTQVPCFPSALSFLPAFAKKKSACRG